MTAKQLAWITSTLLVLALILSTVGFSLLLSRQRRLIDGFYVNEYLDARRTINVLEQIESGDSESASALMIERTFTGLTRLQPHRDRLPARYLGDLDDVVRRFAAYRGRNPRAFEDKQDWWLSRFDGWVSSLN
jgi:hypothetical protein